ncbi:MAG: hypothetical protein LBH98_06410 [Chitinispirillales bacterium]|jgi:hypothetical protein|nr:hypothetical protein [Chitinispirillales bacterium]
MRRVQDLFRDILIEEYAAAHKLFENYNPVAGLPARETDWLHRKTKEEHLDTKFGYSESREIVTSLENPWYAEDTSFEHRGRRTVYAPEIVIEQENSSNE